MKKIIIGLLIIIVFIVLIAFAPRSGVEEKSVVTSEDHQSFQVLSQGGEILLDYSIQDWRFWLENNWERFLSELPKIGEEEMGPERFYQFDAVALSPDFQQVAFTTSAYAMLTDLSLINVIDLSSGEAGMVSESVFGQVQEIIWSPSGEYVAYVLNTARAAGDRLSVDNISTLSKEFVLTDQEIILGLRITGEHEQQGLNPNFRELNWTDDGERLYFITDALIEDQDLYWSINPDGTDLVLEEQTDKPVEEINGNLMINSPGLLEDTWHLSHEAPGSPGLLTRLEVDNIINCLGSEYFCQGLTDKDESLAGTRVAVKGLQKEGLFEVEQIELKD